MAIFQSWYCFNWSFTFALLIKALHIEKFFLPRLSYSVKMSFCVMHMQLRIGIIQWNDRAKRQALYRIHCIYYPTALPAVFNNPSSERWQSNCLNNFLVKALLCTSHFVLVTIVFTSLETQNMTAFQALYFSHSFLSQKFLRREVRIF